MRATHRSGDTPSEADGDSAGGATLDQRQVHGLAQRVEPGTMLGRFEIRRLLGTGGIARVYAAYDPELDREVAVKVLHRSSASAPSTSEEPALVREARLMASLSHPHVAQVLFVGELSGCTAIVMELLPGGTLTAWLEAKPRRWQDQLAMFVAAAAGLTAAHDNALVHRDFKPDNVLIGADGQPRVTDFGLARVADEPSIACDVGRRPTDPAFELSGVSLQGTPAYMAPEQHLGLPAGPRADQFSFAVALYEALYQRRPFAGQGLAELAIAVTEGQIVDPPAETKVPAHIGRAIVRALQTDPAARWPDMRAFVAALTRTPTRRPWILAGVGAMAVAAAFFPFGDTDERCTATQMDSVWGAKQRKTLEGRSSDDPTTMRFAEKLDAWSERWREAYAAACEGESDTHAKDLRLVCLSAQLRQADAVVTSWIDTRTGTRTDNPEQLPKMLAMVPDVSACADIDAMRQRMSLPADASQHDAVIEARDTVTQTHVLVAAGKLDAALERAQATAATANELNFGPLRAQALHALGVVLERRGDYDAAAERLTEAEAEARAHGLDTIVIEAGIELSYVVGYRFSRPDEGLRWARSTHAAIERSGGNADAEARLFINEATLRERQGDYQGAYAGFDRARARLEERDDPKLPSALINMGLMLNRLGRPAEAAVHLQRAITLLVERSGREQRLVATALNHLGMALEHQHDFSGANARYREALALSETVLGEDHPQVATSLNNVALMELKTGNLNAARGLVERGLTIRKRALGSDSERTAFSMNLLAVIVSRQGDYDRAIDLHNRALTIYEASLGPAHPEVASVLDNLGTAFSSHDEDARALEQHQRALEIRQGALGPDHRDTATSQLRVGEALIRVGRASEARPLLELARPVLERELPEDHLDRRALATALDGMPE